eukprot:1400365-Prorocentrum_lima.AAC.1
MGAAMMSSIRIRCPFLLVGPWCSMGHAPHRCRVSRSRCWVCSSSLVLACSQSMLVSAPTQGCCGWWAAWSIRVSVSVAASGG